MKDISKAIDVKAPRQKVYNQWTQFETFPRFMSGVKNVRQVNDTTVEWSVTIGGKEKTWRARVTEQRPDERILWVSETGPAHQGRIEFEEIDGERTRIRLSIRYEPESVTESLGDVLGIVERRVSKDLDAFREFIESVPEETGAWRGEVAAGQRQR